jgi:16S rRNA (cytosine967-C5)-methyltransferase
MRLLKFVSGQKPREIAVRVLSRRGSGDYLEDLFEEEIKRTDRLSSPDRRLAQELVYGVVRWQAALDWLITRKTPGRTQKPSLQRLLRLGLYQIFWLDRIPEHAAVHETVELAKQSGFGAQAGFLNAVLRNYIREIEPTRLLLEELKAKEPAIGYSHPDWLVTRWQARWGADKTAQLLQWNNAPPKTSARVNSLKITAEKLLPLWRNENVEYDFVTKDWLPEGLVFELKSHPPLALLPSFQQGLFYVQDPSTILAVRELDPQPGERILDLCAAPGGKLTCIAQFIANQARLIGHDITPERLALIKENCTRLGVTCVETVSGSVFNSAGSFDRILIDAPCSNTGVMRRRVDLRWRVRIEEIERLRTAQLDLLRQAAPLLRTGGTLVYSTCSLEPEENSELVTAFLKEYPAFVLVRSRELVPFVEKVDGAYVARMLRQ